jgi:hypothetical protein
MPEIVYVLTNVEMPGCIKIGKTSGESVEARMKALFTTSVPLPFECFYAAEVKDAALVERTIHQVFAEHRVHKNREFFRIARDKPKLIIKLLEIRDVTPKDDVVSEPGDQEALDEAKKRAANFRSV